MSSSSSTGAPKAWLDQHHPTSDRGTDCTPDHKGIPLGRSSALPDPRSGSGLRGCCHPPITGHGHPRRAHCPRLALAERLRRKNHRIAPDPMEVCCLLQRARNHRSLGKDAPIPIVPSSTQAGSRRSRSWVAFTTIIVEFSFRYRQGHCCPMRGSILQVGANGAAFTAATQLR